MKKLRLLDSSGDTVIEFDEIEATVKARDEARALFERLREKGAAIFAVSRGGNEVLIPSSSGDRFKPDQSGNWMGAAKRSGGETSRGTFSDDLRKESVRYAEVRQTASHHREPRHKIQVAQARVLLRGTGFG